MATLAEDTLRELLLEAAERDRGLRDKLLLDARAANADDFSGMKAAVRRAVRVSRPLDWREAGGYGDGLMVLADRLRQQLAGPHAAQVVELAELAIAGAEHSLEQIDDSGGYVMPGILELATVHLDAYHQVRPDPVKLAERLFRLQTEGIWDTFYDVLPAYEAPLYREGLHRYRELVERSWDALPPLAPGRNRDESYDERRIRLEHSMIALAERDGDGETLIRVYAKDLSQSHRFALIAELCAKHGRHDEGLSCAERGLRERALAHLWSMVVSIRLNRVESSEIKKARLQDAAGLDFRMTRCRSCRFTARSPPRNSAAQTDSPDSR